MADLSPADLTVIIPTRDRWDILARTLDGLQGQTLSGFETIVVVDGADQLPPDLAGIRVLRKERGGPGAARNAGAAASERTLLLFLGDDMVPDPMLIERHLDRHRRFPEPTVAVLGRVDWHNDVASNPILRWMDWSATQFDFRLIDTEEAGFGRFFSCNVSLKRRFFLDTGGFDEDFVFFYEDLDCGYRLDQRGMRLMYEPAARVNHLHDYDLDGVKRRFEGIARGERMMAAKHDWFTPFFKNRVQGAQAAAARSPVWPKLAEWVPEGTSRLRRTVERRANEWYYQQVAQPFLSVWDGDRDLEELRAYLGDRFDQSLLYGHAAAVDREEEAVADEATFYRTSRMYLYDLTAFAMAGTKVPYLADLRRVVPPGARLLDFGCGIGSDGLRLMEAGYRVSFADFDNPSTAYLRWRLARRGLEADVLDLDGDVPGRFDAAYSLDVIEHVEDPFAFLDELERRASVVMVNFLEPDPHDTHLHRPLPIAALLDHAASSGLLRYRRYHGRSHLVIYRTDGRPGVAERVRGRTELFVGRRPLASTGRLDRPLAERF